MIAKMIAAIVVIGLCHRPLPFEPRHPTSSIQAPGEPQRQQHPQHPERPAANDVARPVDAEHHPAGSDRQRQQDRARGSEAMPARSRGQHQGKRQIEDHRAGRVPAREGRGLHHHQMRLEIGAHARDPIFLRLAQAASDRHDRDQHQRQAAMPRPPEPRGQDDSGADQHRRFAERGEETRDCEQRRPVAGVERFVDVPVERPAAPHQHREPHLAQSGDKRRSAKTELA